MTSFDGRGGKSSADNDIADRPVSRPRRGYLAASLANARANRRRRRLSMCNAHVAICEVQRKP